MILIDTNFIVYAVKYKIAHLLEANKSELAVPAQVVKELEMLSKTAKDRNDRASAGLAIELIRKWKVPEVEEDGNADEAVLKIAVKNKAKAATMDKALSKKLKERGITVLKIRQKKYITED